MTESLYLFAGGGTGGHLFPGIAVAECLRERDPHARVLFVSSDRRIEREILAKTPFEHLVLPALSSTGALRSPLQSAGQLWRAFREARRLLDRERPTIVIGCGGFASAAPVVAARRHRIPVILLEQNVIPGRATRWLSRLAETTCGSFEQTGSRLSAKKKAIITGNPVRRSIAALLHESGAKSNAKRTLLVLGGSQGAQAINQLVLSCFADNHFALSGWRIVHQSGNEQEALVRESYARQRIDAAVSAFFDNSADLYRQADLAISRAGGTTLAELACAAVPAILLPYPHAVSNHQWHNADLFRRAGAAILLDDRSVNSSMNALFAETLSTLLGDQATREQMASAMRQLARPDAAAAVCNLIADHISKRSRMRSD